VRVEANPATHQIVLWAMGEAHLEVMLERLRERYGVEVDTEPVKVSLRETFRAAGAGHGRHVKQSGGHGQYAVVVVEGEPGPPGSGIVFEQRIVGGTVPSQFHGSVEKGIRAQAERGVSGDRQLRAEAVAAQLLRDGGDRSGPHRAIRGKHRRR
jgi:elongation factor G